MGGGSRYHYFTRAETNILRGSGAHPKVTQSVSGRARLKHSSEARGPLTQQLSCRSEGDLGNSCLLILSAGTSGPMVLKLEHASESPGGPVKTHIAEPYPQSF